MHRLRCWLTVSGVRGRYEPALSHPDALTLLQNSLDLPTRLRTIASNAATLVKFLEAHPLVKTVHSAQTPPGYLGDGVEGGGAIGLISVILTKESAAQVFFDALNVRTVELL